MAPLNPKNSGFCLKKENLVVDPYYQRAFHSSFSRVVFILEISYLILGSSEQISSKTELDILLAWKISKRVARQDSIFLDFLSVFVISPTPKIRDCFFILTSLLADLSAPARWQAGLPDGRVCPCPQAGGNRQGYNYFN